MKMREQEPKKPAKSLGEERPKPAKSNIDHRHEPPQAQRRDLAPPGHVGAAREPAPARLTKAQSQLLDAFAARRHDAQLRDEIKNKGRPGMRGETAGPYLAKVDFDRATGKAPEGPASAFKLTEAQRQLLDRFESRQRELKERAAVKTKKIGDRGPHLAKHDFDRAR
jgi:hypothetical protein